MRLLQGYTDAGIASWSGNDDEAHAARHDHGAAGVISVTSNVVPGLFSHMMKQRDDAQNDSLQVSSSSHLAWQIGRSCSFEASGDRQCGSWALHT